MGKYAFTMNQLNPEGKQVLDAINHPLRAEIEALRQMIIESIEGLSENIKWNGPNYCFGEEDRITMKIQPPKQIQLIFHRGVKKMEQPNTPLIADPSGLLTWKENDRAIASFESVDIIISNEVFIKQIVTAWIDANK